MKGVIYKSPRLFAIGTEILKFFISPRTEKLQGAVSVYSRMLVTIQNWRID